MFAGFLLLLMASGVSVVHGGDADRLVDRVATKYQTVENYYFSGTFSMVADIKGFVQRVEAPFVMAGKSPGKYRQEIDHETLGVSVVCDGDTTWRYFKVFNQYRRESAVLIHPGFAEGGEETGPGDFLTYFVTMGSDRATPLSIGQANVSQDGKNVRCEVVEVTYSPDDSVSGSAGPDTLWIEPENALVLKSAHRIESNVGGMAVEMTVRFDFRVALTEWAPPDTLFVFTPPPGAKLVADFSAGPAATDLTGTTAPDFTLYDLKGSRHRLGDYEGKVVLLDFWASWCAPCRRELPAIETLQRRFATDKLVVLTITNENKDAVESFVKKHQYALPVLLDTDGSVFDEYQVSSIPVVIIVGRSGKVAEHFVGLHDEAELLEAVRRAGVDQ